MSDPTFTVCTGFEDSGTLPEAPPAGTGDYRYTGYASESTKRVKRGSYAGRIQPQTPSYKKQIITLTGFGGTDSFKLQYSDGSFNNTTVSFVRGTNATAAAIQTALRAIVAGATDLTVTGTTDAGPFTVDFLSIGGLFSGEIDPAALRVTNAVGCSGAVTPAGAGSDSYDYIAFNAGGIGPMTWSVYFRFDTLPNSDCYLFTQSRYPGGGTPDSYVGVGYNSSTGALRAVRRHFSDSATRPHWGPDNFVPLTGHWYLLDMAIDSIGNVKWQVNGLLQEYEAWADQGLADLPSDWDWLVIGNPDDQINFNGDNGQEADDRASTFDLYIDDWVVVEEDTATWAHYAIGEHTNACSNRSDFLLPQVTSANFDQLLTGEVS